MEPSIAAEILASMGLPGLIIAGLVWFCKRTMALNDTIQEKRLEEMRESLKALNANTAALQALTEVVRASGRG